MITSSSSALWYLSRGTGVVTLVLFTVVIVLGVLTKGGKPLPGLPRFAVAGLHRNASLLAIAFLVIHIVTAVVDPFVTIKWIGVVVPFIGSYHPLWIGLGALSLDLMLAVVVTSLLRQRIGRGVWRAVHWTAYAAWPLAIIHSFTLGPDVRNGLELVLGVACVLATGLAIAWRVTVAGPRGMNSSVAGGPSAGSSPRIRSKVQS